MCLAPSVNRSEVRNRLRYHKSRIRIRRESLLKNLMDADVDAVSMHDVVTTVNSFN